MRLIRLPLKDNHRHCARRRKCRVALTELMVCRACNTFLFIYISFPVDPVTAGQSLPSISSDEVADSDAEAGLDVAQGRGLPPASPAGPMPIGPCEICFITGIDCLGFYIRNTNRRRQMWALSCLSCSTNKKKCVKFVMDDIPLARAQRPEFEIPTPTEDANFAARAQVQRKMTIRLSDVVKKSKSRARTDNGSIPVASGSRPRAPQSRVTDSTASGMFSIISPQDICSFALLYRLGRQANHQGRFFQPNTSCSIPRSSSTT